MSNRILGPLAAAVLLVAPSAWAQGAAAAKEPMSDGRTLSEWVAELESGAAPQTRNAAAYEISGMGPAAAPAVPALIKALDDPEPTVRFPVLVALGEIVHDIDCKDAKFGRAETAGVLAVIQGIANATTDDAERISRGSLVLDGLYAQLS